MEEHKSILEFDNYLVNKATYYLNTNFIPKEDSSGLDVDFDIHAKVANDVNDIQVTLTAKIGDEDNQNCPFIIEVKITGFFSVNNKNEDVDFTANMLAILFPYLRSIISELSVKSNIFPDYRLPLMNLYSFLKENNRIEVIEIADEE